MPQATKTRSSQFLSKKPLAIAYKKRHASMTHYPEEGCLQSVHEVIDQILAAVSIEQKQKDLYLGDVLTLMDGFDLVNANYYELTEPEQLLQPCRCEDEPLTEAQKHIEVVPPGYLKNIVKVPALPFKTSIASQNDLDSSYFTQHRESMISKLKKQYSSTINSKIMGESMPLEYFKISKDEEDEAIEGLRKGKGKGTNKMALRRSVRVKVWNQENQHYQSKGKEVRRKENRMPTIFKKNKMFIDKIDPTSSNLSLDYLNAKSNGNANSGPDKRPRVSRMSFILGQINPNESPVTAKLTNSLSVGLLHPSGFEKVGGSGPRVSKEVVRLPLLGVDRDELNKRVGGSVHVGAGVHMRKMDSTERKIRVKNGNSMSIGHLPRLSKR